MPEKILHTAHTHTHTHTHFSLNYLNFCSQYSTVVSPCVIVYNSTWTYTLQHTHTLDECIMTHTQHTGIYH